MAFREIESQIQDQSQENRSIAYLALIQRLDWEVQSQTVSPCAAFSFLLGQTFLVERNPKNAIDLAILSLSHQPSIDEKWDQIRQWMSGQKFRNFFSTRLGLGPSAPSVRSHEMIYYEQLESRFASKTWPIWLNGRYNHFHEQGYFKLNQNLPRADVDQDGRHEHLLLNLKLSYRLRTMGLGWLSGPIFVFADQKSESGPSASQADLQVNRAGRELGDLISKKLPENSVLQIADLVHHKAFGAICDERIAQVAMKGPLSWSLLSSRDQAAREPHQNDHPADQFKNTRHRLPKISP